MDFKPEIQSIRMQISMPERAEDAFSRLHQLLEQQYPELVGLFTIHQAAYRKNEQENIEGTIRIEDYRVEYRKVIRAVNHLLDRILLEENRLAGATLRKGSDLSVISCNRKEIIKRFSISLDTAEEAGRNMAVYLLMGRKFGQADSLVKRLITTIKEERQAVKYAGFNQIAIRDIDLGSEDRIQDACFFFRKAFNRHLRPQVKSLADFARNIELKYPAYRRADYIPFAFRISFYEANLPLIESFLQWLAGNFCRLDDERERRKFVFFFVLRRKEETEHTSIWSRIVKKNRRMAFRVYRQKVLSWQNLDDSIVVLPNLARVRYEDLDDWYKHYENNEALRTEKLRELVRNLGGGTEWNMSQVELELEKVVRAYRDRKFGI